MKKKIILLVYCLPIFGLISCSNSEPIELATIVFTNDIHSYIANEKDGNILLRLSQIGAYVDDLKSQGKNTLLVDAGDSIQGSVYGSYDEGKSIINIMNKTGFDLSVPGNHDFDYNVPTLKSLVEEADFEFLSCNFVSLPDQKCVFSASKIFEFNKVKIGFVGISTPETLTTSTPTFFQDDKGNWIYDFIGSSDSKLLYTVTQNAVNAIRDKVDYVVALGHLGVEPLAKENGISSINVINNTTGIDLFIDGHSHTEMNDSTTLNKNKQKVLLAQTGSNLDKFGVITIKSDRSLSCEMLNTYKHSQKETTDVENKVIKDVDELMGVQIANNANKLYVNNPDKPKQRLIRAREMNDGDFVADSFYWYLNEYKQLDCDCAIQNGGGVRAEIEPGKVTYKNIKDVGPFNNSTCLIYATGQQIKDAIEMGVTIVDKWDKQWDCPAENGGFLHVAGLKYTVDCNIPTHVVTDEKGMFVKVDGEYRTTDIKIYNKKTSSYEDLSLDKTYRLAGISYLLRNSGNGLSMFKDNQLVVDYLDTDFEVLTKYATSFLKDGDYPLINTQNCVLNKYTNYGINYENPYGAGRINLLNLPK